MLPDDDVCAREEAPGYLVQRAERLFLRSVDRALRSHGACATQLPALFALADSGPMPQRALARRVAATQPAMVATLVRLEREGLVERRDGSVFLTARGRDAVLAGRAALLEANRRALAGLDAGGRAALVAGLRRVIDNLAAEDAPAGEA